MYEWLNATTSHFYSWVSPYKKDIHIFHTCQTEVVQFRISVSLNNPASVQNQLSDDSIVGQSDEFYDADLKSGSPSTRSTSEISHVT